MAGMPLGQARTRSRYGRKAAAISDINVTPLVDVMLVLLIVFMITAPLLSVGVPVELPQAKAKPLESPTEPLTISIGADHKIYVQETEIAPENLIARMLAVSRNDRETRVFIRGDQGLSYGMIMGLMSQISQAGFSKVALVTELPQRRRARSNP